MSDEEWVKNLWATANAITAFAIVQGLAFGYVLGKGEIHARITTATSRVVIVIAALLATIFYCVAVWRLGSYGSTLDVNHKGIWCETTIARIIAVIFFSLLPLIGLFG